MPHFKDYNTQWINISLFFNNISNSAALYFIYTIISTTTLENVTFSVNFYAKCIYSEQSTKIIDNTIFYQCSGAIKSLVQSQLSINNSSFTDNYGGAISLTDSQLSCLKTSFSGNIALTAVGSDISAETSTDITQKINISLTNFNFITFTSISITGNYNLFLSHIEFSSENSQSQALSLTNLENIYLEHCNFSNLWNLSAIKASNSLSSVMNLTINSSNFFNSSSNSNGGAIFLDGIILL